MVHRNWDDKPEPETTIGLLIFTLIVTIIFAVV